MIRVIIEHKTKDKEATRKLVKVIEQVHAEASKQPGFYRANTLVNIANPCQVVVLSSWRSLEDSKAWDESKINKTLSPLIEEQLAEQRTSVIMTENALWKEEIANVFD
jgi:heme-degrading monooxygenase HmoA